MIKSLKGFIAIILSIISIVSFVFLFLFIYYSFNNLLEETRVEFLSIEIREMMAETIETPVYELEKRARFIAGAPEFAVWIKAKTADELSVGFSHALEEVKTILDEPITQELDFSLHSSFYRVSDGSYYFDGNLNNSFTADSEEYRVIESLLNSGEELVYDFSFNSVLNSRLVWVHYMIYDDNNEPEGIVSTGMDVDDVYGIILEDSDVLNDNAGNFQFLVSNEAGEILLEANRELIGLPVQDVLSEERWIEAYQKALTATNQAPIEPGTAGNQESQLVEAFGGVRALVEMYHIAGMGWYIFFGKDLTGLVPFSVILPIFLAGALIFFILVVMTNLIINRMVLTPIVHMNRLCGQLADRNLRDLPQVSGRFEIGKTAVALNLLSGKIGQSLQLISNLRVKLGGGLEAITESTKKAQNSTVRINTSLQDTLGRIDSLNKMTNNTQTEVEHIEQVVGNQAQVTQQQSEQMTMALEDLSDMSNQINDMIEVASASRKRGNELVEVTRDGEEAVKKTLTTVEKIAESVNEMQEFISIINNINHQTNLLAMNAAIEAAHAGESGRGFAVVAGEIRNLAMTTTENAGRISNTLKGVLEIIEHAQSTSRRSSDAINNIDNAVSEFVNTFETIYGKLQNVSGKNKSVNDSFSSLTENSQNLLQEIESINERVAKITGVMGDIRTISDNSTQDVFSIKVQADEIEALSAEIMDLCQVSLLSFGALQKETDLYRVDDVNLLLKQTNFISAIIAHQQLRLKMFNTLSTQKSDMSIEKTAASENCPLGQWIKKWGRYFSHLPFYEQLLDEHEKFHQVCARMVRTAKFGEESDEKQIKTEMIQCYRDIKQLSRGIIDKVIKLEGEFLDSYKNIQSEIEQTLS